MRQIRSHSTSTSSSRAKRSLASFASASMAASLPASRWRWSRSTVAVSTTEVDAGLRHAAPHRADGAVAGAGRRSADLERKLGRRERVPPLVHRRRGRRARRRGR